VSTKRYLTIEDFARPGWRRGLCRVCLQPVGTGRRTTCSAECADRLRVLCFWNVQRRRAEKRDQGVCQMCGFDMWRVRRIVRSSLPVHQPWGRYSGPCEHVMDRACIKWLQDRIGSWTPEIDHIVPVCRGGGVRPDMTVAEVLANLRTLCHDCHASVTAKLAAERAARPRDPADGLRLKAYGSCPMADRLELPNAETSTTT
jgi:5-methylcytosine-specific restriction endonuclease McrA